MNLNKTLAVAGLLTGMLCAPMFAPPVEAHEVGPRNGKHHYCHDKHGRWRSHPHCPAPQPRYGHHRPGYAHYPSYRYSRYPYQHRPEVIYVRRDNPYDYRSRYGKPKDREPDPVRAKAAATSWNRMPTTWEKF